MNDENMRKYLDLFEKRILRSIKRLSTGIIESAGLIDFKDSTLKNVVEDLNSTAEDYECSILIGELYAIRRIKRHLKTNLRT